MSRAARSSCLLHRAAFGGLLVVALVTSAGCSASSAQDDVDQQAYAGCGTAFSVSALDSVLVEASGIAADPRRPDLFWLHNDSGNEPALFAVDSAGRLLAVVRVGNSTDRDIEDITVGRCGSEWCAYVGDIGDNLGVHPSITVHRVPLPPLAAVPAPGGAAVTRLTDLTPTGSWEFAFPDGPRDAEGLVIDDVRGELGIITKGREAEVVLYGARLAELESTPGSVHSLTRIGRLPVPIGSSSTQLVTGADLSPDRSWLALRSYASLFLLPWSGVFTQDTAGTVLSASLLGALEPQGEGVTWSADGQTLWLASEGRGGRPPQLSRIRCPASAR